MFLDIVESNEVIYLYLVEFIIWVLLEKVRKRVILVLLLYRVIVSIFKVLFF